MFIGHFAAAMVGSRKEPRLRLGTAFLAAQLPDVLWPFILLAGIERATIVPGDTVVTPLLFDHYPWSHGLLMVALWGAALGLVLRFRGSGPRLGLGLWSSLALTLLVEGVLFACAAACYARGRRAGKGFFWLVAALGVRYLANLFGPPPPNMTAVTLSAIVLLPLLWLWGNKVDVR